MSKYAIVTTDSGYIYGVNALINSLKYYDNDVTFYHLYYGPKAKVHSDSFLASKEFNMVSVDLRAFWLEQSDWKQEWSLSGAWICKFARYLYSATRMEEFDAVAIFDADMMVSNNIMVWFEIADKTGKVLMPNNDLSSQEYDGHRNGCFSGCSPPLHNMPVFFKPNILKEVFLNIPHMHHKMGVSDMGSFNHSLVEAGMMEGVVVLPNCLWLLTVPSNIRLVCRSIGDKFYLALHKSGDRVNAVHKPWWSPGYCRKTMKGSPRVNYDKVRNKTALDIVGNNTRLFWEMNKFFNTECYHTIPWPFEFPEEEV